MFGIIPTYLNLSAMPLNADHLEESYKNYEVIHH